MEPPGNGTSERVLSGVLGACALDHVALAVRDLSHGLALYRDLLGGQATEGADDLARGFRWLDLRYPNGSRLELITPISDDGFLVRYLARHGEGLHHLTYLVNDVRVAVARAREAGLRIVDEDYRDPSWEEAYISPSSAHGTIVQLVQTGLSPRARQHRWPAKALLGE